MPNDKKPDLTSKDKDKIALKVGQKIVDTLNEMIGEEIAFELSSEGKFNEDKVMEDMAEIEQLIREFISDYYSK